MFLKVSSLLILLGYLAFSQAQSKCTNGDIADNANPDVCYTFVEGVKNFEEARRYCQTEKGGDLFMPQDAITMQQIREVMLAKTALRYWLGIQKILHEWKWTDDSVVTSQGCYDQTRLLQDQQYRFNFIRLADANPRTCAAACRSQGYAWAATRVKSRSAVDCSCAQAFIPKPEATVTKGCNTQCPSDSTLKCGSSNNLDYYLVVRADGGQFFNPWGSSQPNNYDDYQACIALVGNEKKFGDEACNLQGNQIGHICQYTNVSPCPDQTLAGECISIERKGINWFEADKDCRTRGGRLANVKTSAMWTAIVAQSSVISDSQAMFWIGGFLTRWNYVNGAMIEHSEWAANQPEAHDEMCGSTYRTHPNNGIFLWEDFDCTEQLNFVCQSRHAQDGIGGFDACVAFEYDILCANENRTCVQISSDEPVCVCDPSNPACTSSNVCEECPQPVEPNSQNPERPTIRSVYPTYGPLAGETNITITGTAFISNSYVSVFLGARQCSVINEPTSKMITCVTPAFDEGVFVGPVTEADTVAGKQINIKLIYPTERFILQAKQTFRYLPNPTISDFYPKDTIVGGGIAVTVKGEALDSVAVHVMEITMLYKKKENATGHYKVVATEKFQSTCTVLSDTLMSCPTPEIQLPANFVNLTVSISGESSSPLARKRRQSASGGGVAHQARESHRWIRQANDDEGQTVISDVERDNEKLEFYVTFKSDGVTTFEDETEDNVIRIYGNPSFLKFAEERTKYDPNANNPFISIQGRYLLYGASAGDYKVIIGVGVCEDVQVTDNQLMCLPPGKEPGTNMTAVGSARHVAGAPAVLVYAGYTPYYIGHLDYTGERLSTSDAAVSNLYMHGQLLIIILLCSF